MRRHTGLITTFLPMLLLAAALIISSCSNAVPEGNGIEGGENGSADQNGTSPDNDFSFLVCGDTHARTDLLEEIVSQAREGEFLVIVGDISTGRGLAEMQAMKDYLDGTGLSYHVIPGDNDMPGGDKAVFEAVFGPDHYAIDFQDAHLVFLNDAVRGVGCPDEQLAWLRDDLSGLEGERLLVGFAHVPPGAPVDMGKDGFQEEETESAGEMLDILRQAGAAALYCGHIHAYMLYGSGPPRVVVSGGGGADPHLSEQAGGFHHFLRVTVKGSEVTEEVIPL
ncbi:MAG: metallophosphoesterase [Actinomycetota bacterium]